MGSHGKDKGWADLTDSEKDAAAILGFNAISWDAGESPAPCLQVWASLCNNAKQLTAAIQLGYTQAAWDAELGVDPAAMAAAAAAASAAIGSSIASDYGSESVAALDDSSNGDGGNDENTTAAAEGCGGGGSTSVEGLQKTYKGMPLVVSEHSGTGYKGVCLRPGNRYTVTFNGRSHGAFSTPIEAAYRYAELIGNKPKQRGGAGSSSGGSGGGAVGPAAGGSSGTAATSASSGHGDAAKRSHHKKQQPPPLPPPEPPAQRSHKKKVPEAPPAGAANGIAAAAGAEQAMVTEVDGLQLHLSPSSHTGYKGVGKQNSGPGKQYQAHLGHGAGSSLGYFSTAVEAAVAYAKRVKELRGSKAPAPKAPAPISDAVPEKRSHHKRKAPEDASNGDGAPPVKRSHHKKATQEEGKVAGSKSTAAATKVEAPAPAAEEEEEAAEGTGEDVACNKCGRKGDAFRMLLCDGEDCDVAQHIYCCDPPLLVAPAGDWFCSGCRLKRASTSGMTGRQQMRYLQQLAEAEEAQSTGAV